ncbi:MULTISPECIES: MFS transporter [Pseudomonas]|uniref:Putative transporter, membrane protein n=1 Tax=Pseudomonas brassicacearum (strain NFM421) TaxID=994484 RepID=F2KJR3_PSEBN|nr:MULTISPECIES: MFS transporter [Pseudomonas]EIK66564.1 transporter, major facilitator family [Pseudomonas fluorescens Q8r1-96]KIR13916.1 Inner membrane protein YbjJ [Pseudomonas fluorescens]AEA70289.1 Putative transporter, membrane protein [Pseudomonas brassicacearum subsp. brassicacearum NFM421]ALQ04771.1 Membrane protein mosC [Pseudomonas brassicacearum]AOS42066.1 MFS transporter [Pseudomonas brassicacearum]
MTAITPPPTFIPGRLEQMSTRIAYLIAGIGIAAWAPLVPYAKVRANLDEGTLGLLLLCLGVGSILAMPISGALAARFGCRRVLSGGTILICLALPLLATMTSLPWLVAALFLFGAGLGTVDSTVNLQAVIVERASGKTMMSGFHGMFSLGGIIGAAGVSALLGLGLSPLGATLVVNGVLLVALFKAAPHLLPYGSESSGPAFAIPHGVVLFIGILCFIVFLAEGAVLDWSAVFLTTERAVDTAYAGLGYAAFALTMTVGRLTGDSVVHRLGAKRVIIYGGSIAAAGFLLATLAPMWQAALLGYALVGAGCSNIVPVLYTAVGKQTLMPEAIAVPAITTIGYAGILAGPALIGFVAHGSSLSIAFGLIAISLVAVAASGKVLKV